MCVSGVLYYFPPPLSSSQVCLSSSGGGVLQVICTLASHQRTVRLLYICFFLLCVGEDVWSTGWFRIETFSVLIFDPHLTMVQSGFPITIRVGLGKNAHV